jgi:hypothetical protein
MITIKDIIEWSKPHPLDGGKMTRLYNDEIEFSIVGGRSGLYGDFENDFEVAIIDKKSGDFITKFFYPEGSDDVIGYMKLEDVEKLVNQVLGKDFQVF